ncbi:hypothetical protein SBA4_120026 [Candidatus Sulfopaludibacter sp. SbA4]|nr:hypothetical protein SBA4_120026 [Candidatus Sulfopaludibacter sp. SbA4]
MVAAAGRWGWGLGVGWSCGGLAFIGRLLGGRGARGDVQEVFGIGTRFVWYLRDTQEEQVVQGPLVHEVEARFVTVYQTQGRAVGEGGEGGGHAVELVGFRLRTKVTGCKTRLRTEAAGATGGAGGGGVIEHAGFESPGAAHAPTGGGYFLDHAELHVIGGLEAVDELFQVVFEDIARFVLHQKDVGQQSVAHGVARRALLPLRGGGTARARSVGARSQDASQGRHKKSS